MYTTVCVAARCIIIKHSWLWWSQELIALGEVVGTESKGLSAATIASLPSVTYQAQDKHEGNMEQYGLCFLMPYPLTEKVLSV